jgi:hypothetical protein
MPSDTPSLLIENIYVSYIVRTKVYLIRSPRPHLRNSTEGPPSGHASPLGYFDRVVYKLQDFSCKGEPGTWVTRQTGKKKKKDQGLQQGGCSWMYLNVFPMTSATSGSGGRAQERGMPSPT